MRCNFPSPFQQSLVNTVCGETRASPAFPQSRAGAGEPGRGGRRWAPHTLPGQTKAETSGRGCCSCCWCCSPGTTSAPPGGVGVAAEGPLCCAAGGGGGCAGRARAAPRGSIRRGLSCGGRGSEGTRHYGSGRPDAAPGGLRQHRSNLERGGRAARAGPAAQQVPAARSSRAAAAQPRPVPSPPRPRARKVSRRAGPRMRGGAAAGAVPAGPEPGCGWSALGGWRAGLRRESPGLASAGLEGTSHFERGKEMATGADGGRSAKAGVGACVVLPVSRIHPVCT